MVMPMVPLGSSVTSGEFWKPRPLPSKATSIPFIPSRTSTPWVVGTSDVLVAVARQVGGHHGPEHPAVDEAVPDHSTGRTVEQPDIPGDAVVGALHHVERAVPLDVCQRGARASEAVQRVRPDEAAGAVEGVQDVGVAGAGVVGAGPNCYPDAPPGGTRRRRGTSRPPGPWRGCR